MTFEQIPEEGNQVGDSANDSLNRILLEDTQETNVSSPQESARLQESSSIVVTDNDTESKPITIKNPPAESDSNQDYSDISISQLNKMANDGLGNPQLDMEIHKELVDRYDLEYPDERRQNIVDSVSKLVEALEQDRKLDQNGELSSEELSQDDQMHYHDLVIEGIDGLASNITVRRNLGILLNRSGAEAAESFQSAVELADELPVDLIGREAELLREAANELYEDTDKTAGVEGIDDNPQAKKFLEYADAFDGGRYPLTELPISTRVDALTHYLGMSVDIDKETGLQITFGNNLGFDPDKAYEMANQFIEKSVASGKTLNENPDYLSYFLFGMDREEFNLLRQTELLSGKSLELPNKASVGDFDTIVLESFDDIDADGNKYLNEKELADVTVSGSSKKDQVVEALRDLRSDLQTLSDDEFGFDNDGITRPDLRVLFANQQRTIKKLEKMSAARKRLLSGYQPEFDTVDSYKARDGKLARDELEKHQHYSPMSEAESRSFDYLKGRTGVLGEWFYGPTRQDLLYPTMNTISKRVEDSLWRAYIKRDTH